MADKLLKLYMLYHKDVVLPTEKYYVYVHRNPITDKVFYVGSAQGNCMRAYEFKKHRSQLWKDEVKSFGGICNLVVEIVEYFDDPYEAQKYEFKLIYELREHGEAYCNREGDTSFKRKYPILIYHLFQNDIHIEFRKKTELFAHCFCEYGLSRHMVDMLIETGLEYSGVKEKAKGLKITKEGKEHI